MHWDLHGITVAGKTNDDALRDLWRAAFASLPRGRSETDLYLSLDIVEPLPLAPGDAPHFRQGDLLQYYIRQNEVIAHFPRYGQLHIALDEGRSTGRLLRVALEHYGVLEDVIAIALSPHLRRRGKFLIHAFAAVQNGRAVLLVGGIGVGKTTTGMALLQSGWRLLSNDSPILDESGDVLSYPGLLAAHADTMERFAETRRLLPANDAPLANKITVAAEKVWPGVWITRATPAAICFPEIKHRGQHDLEPISAPETLRRLLPQAIEQWDKEMIAPHLTILRRLVEASSGYILHLGPDTTTIPSLLERFI